MWLKCLLKATVSQMPVETDILFISKLWRDTIVPLLRRILPGNYTPFLEAFCVCRLWVACISLHLSLGLLWSWWHQYTQFSFHSVKDGCLAYWNRLNCPLPGLLLPGFASQLHLIHTENNKQKVAASLPLYSQRVWVRWRENVIGDSEIVNCFFSSLWNSSLCRKLLLSLVNDSVFCALWGLHL